MRRTETFQTSGALSLDLRLPSGQIELVAVDGEETTVELQATRDSDDIREVIENARIELRQRGTGHEILVDVQRKRFKLGLDFMRGEIIMRVHAPHGADVEVSTASADVDGRGSFGALRAQVASGDLRFMELGGRVDIKSASGDRRPRSCRGRGFDQHGVGRHPGRPHRRRRDPSLRSPATSRSTRPPAR